jgi:gamma-F420-2:alpha-L-glutamate ligase
MSVLILTKRALDEYENSRLVDSFEKHGIPVSIANPEHFDIVIGSDLGNELLYQGNRFSKPKLVLTRTGSGSGSFVTSLIQQFQESGVICINDANGIEIAKNKLRTNQLLAKNNISIPNTMLVRFPVDVEIVDQNIGWPCVVKVITGSYGNGVYLCEKRRDFKKLMEFIDSLRTRQTLIVQEYVNARPGEDLRVLVIGGKVIGAMRRKAPEGDFRANISAGGSGEPFEITEEIDYIARETARVCGLHIAGIDLLFDDNGFKVCEANSAPGFLGFEKFCNFDVADAIVDYVKFKL